MDDEDRRLIDSAGHRRYLFVCQELERGCAQETLDIVTATN